MSAILKEVRALKKGAEAAQWVAAETNVLKGISSLNSTDFSGIVQHFGESQQGSTKLWEQFDVQTRSTLSNFNIEEIESIFHGFGQAKYEPSKELSSALVKCYFGLGDYLTNLKKEQDPYYESDIVQKLVGSLPETYQKYLAELDDANTVSTNNDFALIGEFAPEVSADQKIELSAEDKAELDQWKQTVESRVNSKTAPRFDYDKFFKL